MSLQEIDSVVVARLGSTRGLGKSQPACFNRQIAMYLASQVGRWSTTVIGRFYGGRDHSTVLHSIQHIQRLRTSSPGVNALLTELQARLDDAEAKESSHRTRPITTVEVDPSWQAIADRIALRVSELLKEELRTLWIEERTLVQPGGKEPECPKATLSHTRLVRRYPMIRNAKDLSPDQKAAIESLLGRRILESEAATVRAFESPTISDQRRHEIADELRRYFAEIDANGKDVSDEEAEDIINEAIRSSRPGYRSVR